MQTATKKPYKGTGMEGWLARWYARTRQNDLDDFRRQAAEVAQRIARGAVPEVAAPKAAVLEVAPGPGYFAIELAKLGDFQLTGLDLSRTLVEIASENARRAGVNVDFRQGDAAAMPFAAASFDLVYCSAAFKNFSEPVAALNEMHRVLRPGGEALVVDLRKDVSLAEIDQYVRRSGRTRLDAWITRWAFRSFLIRRAYSQERFCQLAAESRFGSCQIRLDSIGFEACLAKPAA
ncbi:MAG TPA: class I SAM-dependent methyltransferase [Pirellulales bacterium]|jgi:ubiquinone/menaquinone biosynthesis C-methylase UbiE|nr:class I SAM-dependent methyltransferase [Pirellulales bacterium]